MFVKSLPRLQRFCFSFSFVDIIGSIQKSPEKVLCVYFPDLAVSFIFLIY